MSEKLIEIVIGCVREVRVQQDMDVPEDLGPDTALFGENGLFDSVGLVSLVVEAEEAIEDALGAQVSLDDQKAMSQKHSPYKTIGSLAEYAAKLVESQV